MLKDVLERISYSNLTTYIGCPWKWKLNYVDKLEIKSDSIDTVYGTSLHEIIQNFISYYYSTTIKQISENKKKLIDKYSSLLIQRMIVNKQLREKENPKLLLQYKDIEKYIGYGIDLISQFIPNVTKYFPKSGVKLFGIELQIKENIEKIGIPFLGYLDIVLYNEKQDLYTIIDLKTSRMGWKDKQKKDESKRLQLILYKYFLSQKLKIDIDKIDVQFIILKKQVFQSSQFKIKRIQTFTPPNSSVTVKKAVKYMDEIIEDMQNSLKENCFIKNPLDCKWCPYKDRRDLCDRGRNLPKSKKSISQ